MDKDKQFILWFDQVGIEDVKYVGGKNASLGEMYRFLTPKGINVPNGFCVTAYAYRYFIEKAGLKDAIQDVLKDLNTRDVNQLAEKGSKIRHMIVSAEMPPEMRSAIVEAYGHLCLQYGENTDVAVRSSATAEDLPDASFAGQQESYLNVRGEHHLIESVKMCFASLFTNRAISYRIDKGFDHFSIALSAGVQKMVRSDVGASGVMFSIDTETGFKDVAFITAIYGLGENIVQGIVNPDEYYVFKPTMKQGYKSIISKKVGLKDKKLVYSTDGNHSTKEVNVDVSDREKFVLNDDEILTLAKWATEIEEYYSNKHGHYMPMDMEWAKDGILNKLFIVQARPETVESRRDTTKIVEYKLKTPGKVLISGKSVGRKIGKGKAHVIRDVSHIGEFRDGEVLVTEMTDPDWEPIMKKASAIVTNRGGRTCHAAIISRELGIPCVVGTGNATKVINTDQDVTVDCSEGDIGSVYEGLLDYEVETNNLKSVPQTKTKIMMNVGNPDQAFEFSFLPNDGVGLAREEFIINSYIKIHPLALLHYDEIKDEEVKAKIDQLTAGYDNKAQFFIDKLSYGVGMIVAAFYPKKVIVRLSDFKSNEYASLIGGTLFEPKEDNPMLGWRGASRYYSDKYKEAFALECRALEKVREVMGLKNVVVMIPFCRTIEEGKKVLAEMKKNGLEQHKNGLEVYAMCEIPSNVILADQFLDIFDGFSIGSNDLTQLTLGVDRDSELVANVYDERNDAVVDLIGSVIEVANRKNKYIGICGQAPSDYPEFAEMLVRKGIKSISLNPDTVIDTRLNVKKVEDQLGL
ncbi:MAG: phosphoenolpyruvate synthase [Nitrospiraceae bacterium]|nr:phosphoenolpyruvate synthase [Nitrospiraceae bacterium]